MTIVMDCARQSGSRRTSAKVRRLTVALIAAATLLLPATSPVLADRLNTGVIAPQGATYGQLGGRWWQYVFSTPLAQNPALDPTGADCAVDQSGPVFFLVGAFSSGSVTRTCTIPRGKALFFPLINVETDNFNAPCGPSSTFTADQLLSVVKSFISQVDTTSLHASVDGVPVQHLAQYGPFPTVFEYTLAPAPNSFDLVGYCNSRPLAIYPAAAAGYYLFLAPLRAGQHTINFGGALQGGGFSLDITYQLTVQP